MSINIDIFRRVEMPDWNEYKTTAKARGALALELYVVFSTPIVGGTNLPETLPKHLEYQRRMEIEGRLVLAGPLADLTGANMEGAGLIIYRAASLDEARALAEADPMHLLGARSFELRRWLVNEGSINISVGLSTQSAILS
jgi:uncharacterized protein YciI